MTEKKVHKCELCPEKFSKLTALYAHEKWHTNNKPKFCTKCDAQFPSNCALKRHSRVHTGERPYSSRFCSMTFRNTGHRSQHEKKHKINPQYECQFKVESDLPEAEENEHDLNNENVEAFLGMNWKGNVRSLNLKLLK